MINKYFLAFSLATALVGCGGSGEDLSSSMDGSGDGSSGGSGGTTNQSAEGLWSGEITKTGAANGMPTAGIVLSSGDYYFATGTNYTSLIVGKGSTSGSTFKSNKAFSPDKSVGFIEGTLSGAVTTKKELKPVLKNSTPETVATGALNYLDSYTDTPSLNLLYGSKYTSTANPIKFFTFKSEKQGAFSFNDEICIYSGTLSTINGSRNYYLMSMDIYKYADENCTLTTDKTPMNGYAFIKKVSDTEKYLYLVGISTDDKWFSGAFEQSSGQ